MLTRRQFGRAVAAGLALPALSEDPLLVGAASRPYVRLPGGHQEGWADGFANVMRDIYSAVAGDRAPDHPRPPAYATFDDGYRAACVVEALLESHRRGGVWTSVRGS